MQRLEEEYYQDILNGEIERNNNWDEDLTSEIQLIEEILLLSKQVTNDVTIHDEDFGERQFRITFESGYWELEWYNVIKDKWSVAFLEGMPVTSILYSLTELKSLLIKMIVKV